MNVYNWGMSVFDIKGGYLCPNITVYLTAKAFKLYSEKESSCDLSSNGLEGRLTTKGEVKQLGDKHGQVFDAELFTAELKHIRVSFILSENARRDHKEGTRVYN